MRFLTTWFITRKGVYCPTLMGLSLLLSGCNSALLDPQGSIGLAQKDLIITATWLMLLVVVPVFVMIVAFAWRYRANNHKATYAPEWAHSSAIEVVVWSVPIAIIATLAVITWRSSHALDPRQPIITSPPQATLNIEVVALDWKWLFIYPDYGVASVNELAFPVNTPVRFHLTSQSVMNSFFMPQLGSQLYAMGGMQNVLHLVADRPGRYPGMSANYSGNGFSGMKFTAVVDDQAGFEAWLEQAKLAPEALNWAQYTHLSTPSQNHPVTHYGAVSPQLYQAILRQYMNMEDKPHELKGQTPPQFATSSDFGFVAQRPSRSLIQPLRPPSPPSSRTQKDF